MNRERVRCETATGAETRVRHRDVAPGPAAERPARGRPCEMGDVGCTAAHRPVHELQMAWNDADGPTGSTAGTRRRHWKRNDSFAECCAKCERTIIRSNKKSAREESPEPKSLFAGGPSSVSWPTPPPSPRTPLTCGSPQERPETTEVYRAAAKVSVSGARYARGSSTPLRNSRVAVLALTLGATVIG